MRCWCLCCYLASKAARISHRDSGMCLVWVSHQRAVATHIPHAAKQVRRLYAVGIGRVIHSAILPHPQFGCLRIAGRLICSRDDHLGICIANIQQRRNLSLKSLFVCNIVRNLYINMFSLFFELQSRFFNTTHQRRLHIRT